MTPESGWYPDPTGTAQFRFWDGQTWTTATASPNAQQPTPEQSPWAAASPTSQYGSTGYGQPDYGQPDYGQPDYGQSAFVQTPYAQTPYAQSPYAQSAYANSPYAYGTGPMQAPSTFIGAVGRSRARRSKGFYGIIAGVVALAALFAALIPLATSSGSGSAQGKPGSLHLPASFQGTPRLTGGQADQLSAALAKSWPLAGKVIAGAYGTSTSTVRAFALAGAMPLRANGAENVVSGMERGMREDNPNVSFVEQPTGAYGGVLRCAADPGTDGKPGVLCFFADSAAFGMTAVLGSGDDVMNQAVQLRYAIETPPAS